MKFCNKCFFFRQHKPMRYFKCFHKSCFDKKQHPEELIYIRISDYEIKNKNNKCKTFKAEWKIFSRGFIPVDSEFEEMRETERPRPSPPPPRSIKGTLSNIEKARTIVKERKIKKDIPGALMERYKVFENGKQTGSIYRFNNKGVFRYREKLFRMVFKGCKHMWE